MTWCEYRRLCEIRANFVRISYEFHVNLREFRPICLFHRCIVASLLPLPPLVPCTLLSVCRSLFTARRRTSGTTPGGDSRRTSVCKSPSRRERQPAAAVVDGPRARPTVSAVRPLCTRDAVQGAAARPPPVQSMGRQPCGRWSSPCRPARPWAPPTSAPPRPGSPSPPGSRIRPGRRRWCPGPTGGSGISLPSATRPWRPGGCRPTSVSPSPAPL